MDDRRYYSADDLLRLNLINPSMIYVTALLVTAIVLYAQGHPGDPQAPSVLRLWCGYRNGG